MDKQSFISCLFSRSVEVWIFTTVRLSEWECYRKLLHQPNKLPCHITLTLLSDPTVHHLKLSDLQYLPQAFLKFKTKLWFFQWPQPFHDLFDLFAFSLHLFTFMFLLDIEYFQLTGQLLNLNVKYVISCARGLKRVIATGDQMKRTITLKKLKCMRFETITGPFELFSRHFNADISYIFKMTPHSIFLKKWTIKCLIQMQLINTPYYAQDIKLNDFLCHFNLLSRFIQEVQHRKRCSLMEWSDP